MKILIAIFCVGLSISFMAFAQTPPAPCSSEPYRQFDFWLGDWMVHANGKLAGQNKIAMAHNGCVLTEEYSTQGGYTGQSQNIFDRVSGKWHQTWVDSSGTLLLLNGGLVDGNMVLSGEGVSPSGQAIINRITWTPNDDGSVRQHWQVRAIESEEWQTIFDGLYTKKE